MELHLVQMAIARGKPELNRAKVQALTAPIKPSVPAMIVLPELFSTGYLDAATLSGGANPASGRTPAGSLGPEALAGVAAADRAFLADLARRTRCWVAGTTVEASQPGARELHGGTAGQGDEAQSPLTAAGLYRNLSLLFGPDGSERTSYRKIHPFSYGGEDKLFEAGREIVTVDVEGWVVQPTICYDLRFPELYRAGSGRGTHLILVQANWPEARQSHWRALLQARAIENQAFVAGVNCCGEQDALRYAGGSAVYSPKGEPVAQAGAEEGLLRAKLDLDACKQWRKHFPALRDRQPWDFFAI
ncbi:MAG: carbon-nitrogen family hydrolase [Fibrobacteres bacterium]|nr:carbon-nitrogen family hydrolase [Fibrobacterota bacterium]